MPGGKCDVVSCRHARRNPPAHQSQNAFQRSIAMNSRTAKTTPDPVRCSKTAVQASPGVPQGATFEIDTCKSSSLEVARRPHHARWRRKQIGYYCHSGNQPQVRGFSPASRFVRVVLVLEGIPFQSLNSLRRVYEEECPCPPLSCRCPCSRHCRPFRLRRSRSTVRVAHHGHHNDTASLFNSGRRNSECGRHSLQ